MNWRFVAMPVLLAGSFTISLTGCLNIFPSDSDDDGLNRRDEIALSLNPDDPDTDADGLLDGDEVNVYLTDPLDADSDDDGLLDGDEIANGADPFQADTDGDGYLDRDEVFEGTDPADSSDMIYQGGWPYYFEKDEVPDQDNYTWAIGERVPRFGNMRDQFGDPVDLYDFFNREGKPIIVDVSAEWCGPCNGLAAWLEGEDAFGPLPEFDRLRNAVYNGDVYWITIMGEDNTGADATVNLARRWHDTYPTDAVAVLADRNREHQSFIGLAGWPTSYVLTPTLKLYYRSNAVLDFMDPALELLDRLQDGGDVE